MNDEHPNKTIWTAIAKLRQELAQEQLATAALLEIVKAHRAVLQQVCDRTDTGGIVLPPIRDFAPEGGSLKVYADDRYDAAHPEEEHDGGLGSGDWMDEGREA